MVFSESCPTSNKEVFAKIVNGFQQKNAEISIWYVPLGDEKFDSIFVKMSQRISEIWLLNHFMPLVSFYTPWKYQKTLRFCHVFRGYTKRTVAWNRLIETDKFKNVIPTFTSDLNQFTAKGSFIITYITGSDFGAIYFSKLSNILYTQFLYSVCLKTFFTLFWKSTK